MLARLLALAKMVSKTWKITQLKNAIVQLMLVQMGWALKKSKSRGRYLEHLKEYFIETLFLEREETGRKANPSHFSSAIKSLKTEDGNYLKVRNG